MGTDLVAGDRGVAVVDGGRPLPEDPVVTTRIGLSDEADFLWRFYVSDVADFSGSQHTPCPRDAGTRMLHLTIGANRASRLRYNSCRTIHLRRPSQSLTELRLGGSAISRSRLHLTISRRLPGMRPTGAGSQTGLVLRPSMWTQFVPLAYRLSQ